MAQRCPSCGSKDLWQPRRNLNAFDDVLATFGYRRLDCRGCWKRSIFPIERDRHRRESPGAVSEPTEPAEPIVQEPMQEPEPEPTPVVRTAPVPAPAPIPITRASVVPVDSGPAARTVLGPTMLIKGELYSPEAVQVCGELRGSVEVPGSRFSVEPSGNVTATVKAGSVVVRGLLRGDTEASESITVCQNGILVGDVRSPVLVVEDGAHLEGEIETVARPAAKTFASHVG